MQSRLVFCPSFRLSKPINQQTHKHNHSTKLLYMLMKRKQTQKQQPNTVKTTGERYRKKYGQRKTVCILYKVRAGAKKNRLLLPLLLRFPSLLLLLLLHLLLRVFAHVVVQLVDAIGLGKLHKNMPIQMWWARPHSNHKNYDAKYPINIRIADFIIESWPFRACKLTATK